MRSLTVAAAAWSLVSFLALARAAEPVPPPPRAESATALVHVGISDAGDYAVTVSRSGMPTRLVVHANNETLAMSFWFVDGTRLRYQLDRSGAHPFKLEGEVAPPRGRPEVIGHFPVDHEAIDVRVRVTDA